MKTNLLAAAACALALFTSGCAEGEVAAKDVLNKATAAVKDLDIDLSALGPDAIKGKVSEWTSGLGEELAKIKDVASAEKLASTWKPVADKLAQAKQMLGDKMPNMDSLKSAVDSLKSKFSGDQGIMKALQPLLEKLQALFQG